MGDIIAHGYDEFLQDYDTTPVEAEKRQGARTDIVQKIAPLEHGRATEEDPLIPEGEYNLKCIGHNKRLGFHGTNKFRLKLRVTGGRYDGTILYKHFNIKRVTSEGRIVVGTQSDLLRQYYAVLGGPKITRMDRFAMSVFDGRLIRGRVVTVKSDRDGDETAQQSHYSKVGKLLRALDY